MSHVLITGANRGLGLEHTKRLLERGWHVSAACRQPDKAEALRALDPQDGRLNIYAYDAKDLNAAKALKAQITDPIDLLFANAGILPDETKSFGSAANDTLVHQLMVNTIAPLALVEAFADQVAASEMKVIALQSSRMGSMRDNESGGYYGYRASKAGLNAIGKSLSIDLTPRGITTLLLHPGWVRTDMGGPNGLLTITEAVDAQLDLIARAMKNPAMNGRFFHVSGEDLSW
ncbi:SDR family oxidoreductase [Woodsholea maritima]|uniref:SDR family oxidoreductase n=1 Tax=Woodsholea maritima TaxID=240237 RepID=UPI00036841A1|nr:SDR family oxidoreductase [Woodsholea maritima]